MKPGQPRTPEDNDTKPDQDENLPWPDTEKLNQWLSDNKSHYQTNIRYFMGVNLTWKHCLQTLNGGYQRQRHHAAQHLCLLKPSAQQLFPINAPGWRQQRWLKKMEQS